MTKMRIDEATDPILQLRISCLEYLRLVHYWEKIPAKNSSSAALRSPTEFASHFSADDS